MENTKKPLTTNTIWLNDTLEYKACQSKDYGQEPQQPRPTPILQQKNDVSAMAE
jgi:hypothetical protein